jgi:phospholipid/cholesterol/gamma-HCH transport system substrate-binding protein
VKESYLRDIPADSQVGLASDNLLGEQYIGIRRGKSSQHVQPGGELSAMQSQDITRLMAQMSTQLDRLQAIATRADKLMSGAGKSSSAIDKFAKEGAGVSSELDRLTADIQHGNGTLTKLLYDDPLDVQLRAPLKRLDAIMASVGGTSTRLKEFQDGLNQASSEFQKLQAELKAGKGSFAKIDQLQAQFDELTLRIDGLMDKINSGQGTIGQLMVNPQLNAALDGATREFQALAQGLQANPMKFVRIRLF